MKNSKLRRALLLLACAVMLVSLSVGATLAYLQSTTKVVNNTFSVGRVHITLDEAKVNEYGQWMTLYPGDENTPDGVWDVSETKDNLNRVQENAYKLYPGKQYPKDPTVHVAANSETCYVFVKLNKTGLTYTNNGETVDIEADTDDRETGNANDDAYVRIADQITKNGWELFKYDTDGCPIYLYKNLVNTLNDNWTARDLVVFEEFMIDAYAEVPDANDSIGYPAKAAELEINILAFAIQAEGFSTHTLSKVESDNNLVADKTGAEAAWAAAQFNTSFDQ